MSAYVTVVVPTYQRGALAIGTIRALSAVEPPAGGFEIVLVDDGSDEANARMLEQAVSQSANAKLLRQQNRGPAAARNCGIGQARGALVVFLDDDCRPAPDWLTNLTAPFQSDDESLGAVGGRVVAAPATNWAQRFCSAIEYATGEQPVFTNASTQNACYRRDVLLQVGGFDERFRRPGGDDPDLSARTKQAGYRVEYAPDAVVFHRELETYGDFLRHMYYRGLGDARLMTKLGSRQKVGVRLALAPVFLGKVAVNGWRRTRSKGGLHKRLAWAVLEQGGYTSFLVGTAVGLVRER